MAGREAAPTRAESRATPRQLAAMARLILASRRHRELAFPDIEFGEPAWDMLLDLYVQHVEGRRVFVSSLCVASAVPPTTALRWIHSMVRAGQFVRHPDPDDHRRACISLAPSLQNDLETYLCDARQKALAARE